MSGRNLVIVVDDDRVVVHLIEKILERASVRVSATSSGSGALNLIIENQNEVALVFLDLAMPGLGGVDLARQIRAMPGLGDLPIVAVTADIGPERRTELDEVGIKEVIEKPFRNDLLIDVLRRHGVPVE